MKEKGLPGMLCVECDVFTECSRDAGMEAGYILDDKVSASSSIYGYWPGRGRINSTGAHV